VVDLGPEGGAGGGQLLAVGTPEQVSENARSYTGQYLKHVLERSRRQRVGQRVAGAR
jgi:excinuclease ABC subunit A